MKIERFNNVIINRTQTFVNYSLQIGTRTHIPNEYYYLLKFQPWNDNKHKYIDNLKRRLTNQQIE